jgi:surface antigen
VNGQSLTSGIKRPRGKGVIIALDEPSSLKEDDKQSEKLEKIKKTNGLKAGNLLNQIAELLPKWRKIPNYIKLSKVFLQKNEKYLPHFGILFFAIIAAAANISAASTVDQLSRVVKVDPATASQIVGDIDQYTASVGSTDVQLISTDSSLVMSDGFIDNPNVVATNITAPTPSTTTVPENQNKTISYTIDSGDTLSSISWHYGVEIATIKYYNDSISNIDSLKPGQKIKIPPVGTKVSATKIAQKENKLAIAPRTTTTRSTSSGRSLGRAVYANSKYPYGWCTYYASAMRPDIPGSLGNAGRWLAGAAAQGFSTGSTPAVGAVMVSRESSVGHVAIVESVSGDTFTVSEMNYQGWGIVSRRVVSAASSMIKGFIY